MHIASSIKKLKKTFKTLKFFKLILVCEDLWRLWICKLMFIDVKIEELYNWWTQENITATFILACARPRAAAAITAINCDVHCGLQIITRQKTGYISRYLQLTTPSCHADITRQYTVYWDTPWRFSVLCSLYLSIGNHSSDYEEAVALSVYSEVISVIVSSFIKNVHHVPGRALLADGLTVKSFFI